MLSKKKLQFTTVGLSGGRDYAIAAICCDGLVAYELTSGTVNGDKFLEFGLIPQMAPFDGSSDKSIIVLLNSSCT